MKESIFEIWADSPEIKTEKGRVFVIAMIRIENNRYKRSSEASFIYSDFNNAHKDYKTIKKDLLKKMFPEREYLDKELDECFFSDKYDNGIDMSLGSYIIKKATLYSMIIDEDITPKEGTLNQDTFYYKSNLKCKESYYSATSKLVKLYEKYISERYL